MERHVVRLSALSPDRVIDGLCTVNQSGEPRTPTACPSGRKRQLPPIGRDEHPTISTKAGLRSALFAWMAYRFEGMERMMIPNSNRLVSQ